MDWLIGQLEFAPPPPPHTQLFLVIQNVIDILSACCLSKAERLLLVLVSLSGEVSVAVHLKLCDTLQIQSLSFT